MASDALNDAVSDLEEKRKAELAERQNQAYARARALSTLMLGEILDLGDHTQIMAVPGGWIFTQTHKAGITSTFVPQPPLQPHQVQPEPAIVLPK
jgi:hypothetical protein